MAGQELYRARCQQGWFIVTEDTVRTELGARPGSGGMPASQHVMARGMITSISSKMVAPSVFGMGGAVNITIAGQGADRIVATFVPPKDAKEILRILQ